MTEVEALIQISGQLETLKVIGTAILTGTAFIGAGLSWFMIRLMMRERDF
ncbi:MAG: hypothetical protein Q7Q73_02260 [Verrucomicrobiota bacterium JB024]|nr:hypothetical protein [Verrucomicrobiota bacterium JB024]